MGYYHHQKSRLTRSAWIGLAVFFLVFSCPVKKYIRLQLYKHTPLVETPAAEQFATKDVKDCSIADKQEQSLVMPSAFLQRLSDHPDFVPYLLTTFLSFALFYLIKRKEDAYIVGDPSPGSPDSVPLYLRLRHLQV